LIDLPSLMSELALERPIFHHEADFQHVLAWVMHRVMPRAHVRLEYKPFPTESVYFDIWLASDAGPVAVELKYLTTKLELDWRGERYALRSQGAQDIRRHDFVKDVHRVERVVTELPGATGCAVCLTNDPSLWNRTLRQDSADALFRLHEGRLLVGTLRWADHTGAGTMAKREAAISLTGSYPLRWRDFSQLSGSPAGRFRYLAVPVAAGTVTPSA
jgi:hypothetical protein